MNSQIIKTIQKFDKILTRHQKKRAIQLVLLMLVGGILEAFAVTMIYPFVDLMMNPDNMNSNRYYRLLCECFGISSYRTLLVSLAVAIALLYLIKNIYMLLEYNIQHRYVYSNMFSVQRRLLSNFINKPYEFYMSANSAEIVRIIHSDTSSCFGLLTNLLLLFTELTVSLMLIAVVFIMNPVSTVAIAIALLIMLFVVTYFLKPIMRRCGELYQKSSSGMYKWLMQSIEGIKTVKVMQKESYFETKYNEYGQQYIGALRMSNVLSVVPKYLIEAMSMSSIFFAIAFVVNLGTSFETIIPMLSTIAIAALRLLPSINRISICLSSLSYNEPMLDIVVECLDDTDIDQKLNVHTGKDVDDNRTFNDFKSDVSIEGITYKYPNTDVNVLDGVDIRIKKGESIGIIGASGAGKTTVVDILLGLLHPQKGQIEMDGIDVSNDKSGYLRMIGYIPQNIFILDGSIRENIAFGDENPSDDRIWKALEESALGEYVRNLPDGLDTQIGERGIRVSGGQRQRIGIARALYLNPDILVFDEATSSLDNNTENEIITSINSLMGRRTVIIIAHRLSTIEKCDHVYRVQDGKIQNVNRDEELR